MITGAHIADVAEHSGLIGTPYSELDCQAFVEEVLKRAGMKIINYRGSNHMWRELVYDRHMIASAADIPVGALVFIVRFDGGEKKRGYHDAMGNATHVGIYLGDGQVIHSTTGGVQYGKLARFTDYAIIKDVDYDNNGGGNNESDAGQGSPDKLQDLKRNIMSYINSIHSDLEALEEFIDDVFRNS